LRPVVRGLVDRLADRDRLHQLGRVRAEQATGRPIDVAGSSHATYILDDADRGFASADLTTDSSPDPPWCRRDHTRLAVCMAASRPRETLCDGIRTVRCRAADLVEYCRWDGRSDHRRSDNHSFDFHVAPTRKIRRLGAGTASPRAGAESSAWPGSSRP